MAGSDNGNSRGRHRGARDSSIRPPAAAGLDLRITIGGGTKSPNRGCGRCRRALVPAPNAPASDRAPGVSPRPRSGPCRRPDHHRKPGPRRAVAGRFRPGRRDGADRADRPTAVRRSGRTAPGEPARPADRDTREAAEQTAPAASQADELLGRGAAAARALFDRLQEWRQARRPPDRRTLVRRRIRWVLCAFVGVFLVAPLLAFALGYLFFRLPGHRGSPEQPDRHGVLRRRDTSSPRSSRRPETGSR